VGPASIAVPAGRPHDPEHRADRRQFTTHTVESYISWIDESWKRVGREINSIQMVRKDGRWWITSIIWDEETGAGPVPAKYLPTTR